MYLLLPDVGIPAPYPVELGAWGSPLKILKANGESGRLKIGDVVVFQRLSGSNVDDNWCNNCFVTCTESTCKGSQDGSRTEFMLCYPSEGSSRDPCTGSDSIGQWVTNMSLHYSMDGTHWHEYEKPLTANYDFDSVVTNVLTPPLLAQWIRITPTAWHDYPVLRFECE